MGQPTHGLTQHVGKTQFWQFMPGFAATATANADVQAKLSLAAKLAPLFCQCLPLMEVHPWTLPGLVVATRRTRAARHKPRLQWALPDLARLARADGAVAVYFETRQALPVSLDPTVPLQLVPYTRRINPIQGLFWGQVRGVRVEHRLVFVMRAYNAGMGPPPPPPLSSPCCGVSGPRARTRRRGGCRLACRGVLALV